MDDHQLAGLFDGSHHRVIVEGIQGAGINDLAADALLLQDLGGLHGLIPHQQIGHDGDIPALSADGGLAEGDGVGLLGHLALCGHVARLPLVAVKQLVLKHQDRVVVADGLDHHALCVIGRGGADHLQPGDMGEIALQALGVLRAPADRAHRSPHDHGHAELSVGHIVHFGSLIHQLVHHAEQKVAVLQVRHRAHAGHGGAHAHAAQQDLRNGGVDDPVIGNVLSLHLKAVLMRHPDVCAELISQALGDQEDAAHAVGDVLVLADAVYAGIPAHFQFNGVFQRLGYIHDSHCLNPPDRHSAALPRGGAGGPPWHSPRRPRSPARWPPPGRPAPPPSGSPG